MRERQIERAVGDRRQQRLLLRLAAAFGDQCRADHHRGEIGFGNQPAPERFHQDADLDRAAAKPAMVLGDRQRQPAELGELLPDLGAEAERIVRQETAMVGVVGLRHKTFGTLTQHPLLVAQCKVHLIYFTTAVFLTEGCRPAGSTTIPNS